MRYKGYDIAQSEGHGKAGKGRKKTATIQVREPAKDGYFVRKQYRFIIGLPAQRSEAITKAMAFIDRLTGREDNDTSNIESK
jgi:hypothetical protein